MLCGKLASEYNHERSNENWELGTIITVDGSTKTLYVSFEK
jgi:hypothetical protein